MVKEAIILAGGLGTRLRPVVGNIPKPMAHINGKPFLEYLFTYLSKYNIERIILTVGYKSEIIRRYFGKKFESMEIIYSIEKKLLGTGGAIIKALNLVESENVFVLNGDTFFEIDLNKFYEFHIAKGANLSLALKSMENCKRYGVVKINNDYRIVDFSEKKYEEIGLINGGIYLLRKNFLLHFKLPTKFSFENDFLKKYYKMYYFYGLPFNAYFIDIGIPEDYEKAKRDFKELKY